MAGEFKVKNGLKFSDNSIQTAAAQPVLVSGTSIKTINNESLLGSGNISISGTAGPLDDLTDVVITSPSTGQVLKYNGTNWINDTVSGGSAGTLDDLTDVVITSPSTGQVLKYNGTNWINDTDSGIALTNLSVTDAGGDGSLSYNNTTGVFTYTGPSATEVRAHFTAGQNISIVSGKINVTNVVLSVTGTSPVTSSGGTTPAISLASAYGDTQNPYASKTANYVLAAPNGTSGAPTFRALVAADIPTLNQNTTGTAANVTGTVAIANGGTGQTTAQAAINALLPSQSTHSGKYLTTDGTNVSWATVAGGGGATYTISAETATGGVNLRLTGSDASTDDVKFAEGSAITLTRTDANTITVAAKPKYTRTLEIDGSLVVFNGTKRWWIHDTFTITKLQAYVTTAPTGAAVNIRVNKNAVSAATLSITAGQTKANATVSIALAADDYVTVDITQVGSTIAGATLTLIMVYE
jgi:hypothetical protein